VSSEQPIGVDSTLSNNEFRFVKLSGGGPKPLSDKAVAGERDFDQDVETIFALRDGDKNGVREAR